MRLTRPFSTSLISTAAAGLLAAACGSQADLPNNSNNPVLPTGGNTSTMPPGSGTTPVTMQSVGVPGNTATPGVSMAMTAGPIPTGAGTLPMGTSVTPMDSTTLPMTSVAVSTPVPMTTDSSGTVVPNPMDTAVVPMTSASVPPTSTTGGPGYYISKDWHGCSWTGTDTTGGTSLTPADFTAQASGEPFCIKGSVGPDPDYNGVALLGFNLVEDASASCVHKDVDPTAPAMASVMKMADGMAVDFIKQGADTSFTLRVQIQGPNGHKDGDEGAADRWCANITETNGKFFVPWGAFDQQCWFVDVVDGKPVSNNTADYPTVHPYAGEPLSAVVFTVPGDDEDAIPYDFCVNGWAYGSSAADAPDGTAVAGDQIGVLVDSSAAGDSPRAKVNVGGENYIIQPNAWGNGASATLEYKNNSFTVTSAGGSGDMAPASFPSLYIGSNGFTNGGQYSTSSTDSLPKQISAITSVQSTFRYSGTPGNQVNATYDIWFANSPPSGQYNDGIDGFVMIWLHSPADKHPIGWGSMAGTFVDSKNLTWHIYKGARGDGPEGYNDAPVVNFINPGNGDDRAQNFVDRDIMEFIRAASSHGIGSNMYLTDVFAGFEIWSGGSGLKVDEFKAVVAP